MEEQAMRMAIRRRRHAEGPGFFHASSARQTRAGTAVAAPHAFTCEVRRPHPPTGEGHKSHACNNFLISCRRYLSDKDFGYGDVSSLVYQFLAGTCRRAGCRPIGAGCNTVENCVEHRAGNQPGSLSGFGHNDHALRNCGHSFQIESTDYPIGELAGVSIAIGFDTDFRPHRRMDYARTSNDFFHSGTGSDISRIAIEISASIWGE